MVEGKTLLDSNQRIKLTYVSKKKWTNYSTVSLLLFVQVFLKQTLQNNKYVLIKQTNKKLWSVVWSLKYPSMVLGLICRSEMVDYRSQHGAWSLVLKHKVINHFSPMFFVGYIKDTFINLFYCCEFFCIHLSNNYPRERA